jgi:hypothetical protein
VARNAFEELMLKIDHSFDPDAELKFRKEFKAEAEKYYVGSRELVTSLPHDQIMNTAVEVDPRQLQFNFVLPK